LGGGPRKQLVGSRREKRGRGRKKGNSEPHPGKLFLVGRKKS